MINVRKFFARIYPALRDIAILVTAVVTIIFNSLSSPIRDDIKVNAQDISVLRDKFETMQKTEIDRSKEGKDEDVNLGKKIEDLNTN